MNTATGQTVVLLHCSASSSMQWHALAAQLADRFQVFAPDLHGYGDGPAWSGREVVTLADHAGLVASGLPDRDAAIHVVGHSFGGAVALRLALGIGDRLAGLTLIEPVLFHLLRDAGPADRRLFAEIETLATAVSKAAAGGDGLSGMTRFVDYWSGAGAWSRLRPETQAALAGQAGTVARDFAALFAETTPADAYRELRAPALILGGSDAPAPTQRICALLHAALPGAQLRTIAGAGHMLPLTHRDIVNALIVEHIARNPAVRDRAEAA